MANISTTFGTVDNQSFFAGTEVSAMTTAVTLLAGQGKLKAGSVLGKITANGKYALVNKAATDGSQIASLVLSEDVDTTGADVNSVAYKTGVFRYDALKVAAGDSVANHKEELRTVNIHYKTDRG
ncbi:head decoration protein [Brevibacillus sp. HB2.2]|uniref:head decoration protein n=1 Tax=Brevibacillus sp. HB2.2 TaxID=2738846 RepID=UPI00156AC780|nr:head decoration protein [Brevibacillus sp. HB2.2]NRS50977.1 head decoration protein [Brevibacillus sp. HB2.2]